MQFGILSRPELPRACHSLPSGRRHDPRLVVLLSGIVVIVFVMPIDDDAAVGAAAKQFADRCRSAIYGVGVSGGNRRAGRPGPYLWDEDQVAPGVGTDRMRAGRLRNALDEDAGSIDHAEH